MTKLRKQRKRKTYRFNVNRKRLRNKKNKGGFTCKEIKKEWENKKTAQRNLKDMGLVYDPNKAFKIPNCKESLLAMAKKGVIDSDEEEEEVKPTRYIKKPHVVESLIKEAEAPRAKTLRLPKGQIEWITYLLDKYENDYKAMARDKKNYNQETWKQIRAKIKIFKSIPEHYNEYLTSRNKTHILEPEEMDEDDEL